MVDNNTVSFSNCYSKVVAIAAGEAHTLLLTLDGHVYSWGRGILGRLGRGSELDELFPVEVKFGSEEDTIKIVGIAAGAYHSLALTDDGSVWCWGYNIYGQLGINEEDFHSRKYSDGDYSVVPCLLNKFLELHPPDSSSTVPEAEAEGKESLKIIAVKAGGMMSLCIDNLGALWMWGNCPQQNKELGFSLISNFTPTPVWEFHGHTVVQVACGNEHVVALITAGESYKSVDDLVCYSWGNNSHGQLGLGDKENRPRPEMVKTFDLESPWSIYELSCGAFHTALLTHKKSHSDALESTCWTFGLGDNGQLGHGTTQSTLLPEPVKELPQNVYLVSVDCGLFHTCVVSSDGDVWSWGMEKGLGLCPDDSYGGKDSGDAFSPLVISCIPYQPKFPKPVQVACGAAHTVIVAQEGYKLWSWGRGRSGVLSNSLPFFFVSFGGIPIHRSEIHIYELKGNGKTIDSYTPNIVLWPPLIEDFKQGEQCGEIDKNEIEGVTETDERLSSLLNELNLLQTKLSIMKRYASILHGSIFGEPIDEQDILASLQNSGVFDIAKEWENMIEVADRTKLIKLEMMYQNMLTGVKDKLLK